MSAEHCFSQSNTSAAPLFPALPQSRSLDIMAGVKRLDDAERLIEPLQKLGYEMSYTKHFRQCAFFEKENGGPAHTIWIFMFFRAKSGKIS
ncbi:MULTISPECIES: hypothetical protein [unclassified Bacillus (in: firmicutes)]|uniref:hypothetical protein n=1 Tax=unclassified Bacillus (in: firmicutes) TaxID=185979 RepID=UPI0003F59B0B|nr:hypothetical protein [Bacillus sp. NSP9.1]QHZ45604.1 GrpB family protein [Bacillus sp. NSP9.1]